MSSSLIYTLLGVALFSIGLYGLIVRAHLLRKILALNIMGSGVFLLLVALAKRTASGVPDPVPHAMVITGIVVAVSATALALTLMLKLVEASGSAVLDDASEERTQ
ncbi:MAG: cation:proton antiporter subunit C [Sedimenticola sp.]|nr:cation:proton antiporter subunit C [Sedimenticola sp.]